jgi:mannose-6-phosphate isomerase-like protein (cupin superfamily)
MAARYDGGAEFGKDWDGLEKSRGGESVMEIRKHSEQTPFTTKDGSTITSLLDSANAPVKNQSLAEARIPAGGATQRHYHKVSEEFYYITSGTGLMEIDGETREVLPGDAILIPPGAWHEITATADLAFLCCCAPPYEHEDTYFE